MVASSASPNAPSRVPRVLAGVLAHPLRAVLAVASLAYAWFIVRASTTIGGERYFTLFDDAMVSMVYGRQLAEGRGLVWLDGARVEGYTNLGWTLWMAALHLVGLDGSGAALAVSVTGAVILCLVVVVTYHLAGEITSTRWVAVVAAGSTAFCYPLVYWTLRGMEVGLVALLLATATLLTLRLRAAPTARRALLLGLVLGAAVLTRNDSLLPAAALVGMLAIDPGGDRRSWAVPGGILLAAVALQVAFRWAYYGELVPNTYVLKMEGVPLADRIQRGVSSTLAFGILEVAVPIALVAAALVARKVDRPLAIVLAPVAVIIAYSTYVGGDAWEWMGFANRYLATAMPLLLVAAAVAVERLSGRAVALGAAGCLALLAAVVPLAASSLQLSPQTLESLRSESLLMLTLAAIPLLLLWRAPKESSKPILAGALLIVVANLAGASSWLTQNAPHSQDWDRTHVALGLAARDGTDPEATIAVYGAGATPYYARRSTVDLLGKSDPVIAAKRGVTPFYPGHTKWDYGYSVCQRRPDIVLELWRVTPDDRATMENCGYVGIDGDRLVESGTDLVDVERFEAELERLTAP